MRGLVRGPAENEHAHERQHGLAHPENDVPGIAETLAMAAAMTKATTPMDVMVLLDFVAGAGSRRR
ncbi:MAG: hypothetical protein ABIR11_10040 [Candidatus Limnocylindrales bacterium]